MKLLNLSVTDETGSERFLCSVEVPPYLEELTPAYIRAKAAHLVENLIARLDMARGK